jgi:Flp pilus assembly protein protease CpaA
LPKRLRTFIGAIALAVFIPLYAMTAMVIASVKLPGAPVLVQTIAYAVLGLLWVIPAGAVVAWMARPDRRSHEPGS